MTKGDFPGDVAYEECVSMKMAKVYQQRQDTLGEAAHGGGELLRTQEICNRREVPGGPGTRYSNGQSQAGWEVGRGTASGW